MGKSFIIDTYKKGRRKRRGWKGESLRHSLAARGIKTKKKRHTLNIVGGKSYSDLNSIVFDHLYKARRPMTSREISLRSHISWETVRKELKELEIKGKIKRTQSGERVYWEAY